jgi:4-carboxymuconolactone decarboxylase
MATAAIPRCRRRREANSSKAPTLSPHPRSLGRWQPHTSPEDLAAAPDHDAGAGPAARPPSLAFMTSTYEQGMRTRREILGDEHVDRAIANTTDFTRDFQDFITRYAWGEIWTRPGLTRAERSMITLTALAALRQDEELAMHTRAALRNGLTPDQIREVLLQVAVYAGVPAANRAFAVVSEVLRGAGPAERPPGVTG